MASKLPDHGENSIVRTDGGQVGTQQSGGGLGGNVLFLVFLLITLSQQRQKASPPTATFVCGGEHGATVTLEVADTPAERQRGLMGRRSLARNHGMVFVFDEAAPRWFWMKNTYIPLDVIFIGPDGRVLNVAHATPQPNAPESELRRYESAGPAKYVIEVRRGFASRTGVGPGSHVRFSNVTFETPGGR